MAGEGVNFNEFELSLTINAGRAEAGTAAIVRALKAIEAASVRAAKVTEEQLAKRATDAQIRAAEKALRAQEKAARQATMATEKAARQRVRAEEKASREISAAARSTAREQERAARMALRAQESAARRGSIAAVRAAKEQERAAHKAAAEAAKAAKKASDAQVKAMGEAKGSALSLQGALVGAFAGQVARSVIGTIASYEQLKASLVTVEKTQAKANATFAELQKFAAVTPFTTEQATKAWIRMRAAGLEPTIDKLRAFGDASSIVAGKDVLDFVEAVADATQGGKVRLKEFGIDMDKMGGKVRLAFGDMAVVVKNDAKSIEQGLVQLTKANFGGAMARQSQTLAGVWSTLKDNAANLAMEIGEGGLLPAMKEVVAELSKTTMGGESAAKSLGADLGTAVRGIAATIRFLATHLSEVKAGLAAFAAYKTINGIASVAGAFSKVEVAANGTKTALFALNASNPWGWIVIGIGLMVELAAHADDVKKAIIAAKGAAGLDTGPTGRDKEIADKKAEMEAKDPRLKAEAWKDWWKKSGSSITAKASGLREALPGGAGPSGAGLAPKGGGFGEKKSKVDPMAESLADLHIQAMAAAEAFGLYAGNPEDIKGLEIQNRLLAERKKLLDAGKSEAEIAANSDRMLADITTAVNAEAALETLKSYTAALRDLSTEAANAEEILGLKQAGASARDIEVATQMQAHKGAGYDDAQLGAIKAKIEAAVDAKIAADELDAAEAAFQESKKKAAADIAKAQEEAAEAQADAEKAALERRKELQQEWVDFAIDGIESLGDALTAALDGQENAWRDFFIQLAIAAANLGLSQYAGGGFGAAGGTGAAVFHGGGTVGAGGGSRTVSPAAFWGAPRMHSGGYAGLRPDEVPAILQRGERVLSRREVAGGIGGRSNRNYAININLNGVNDIRGFNRATPALLRRLRGLTSGGDDD